MCLGGWGALGSSSYYCCIINHLAWQILVTEKTEPHLLHCSFLVKDPSGAKLRCGRTYLVVIDPCLPCALQAHCSPFVPQFPHLTSQLLVAMAPMTTSINIKCGEYQKR